MLSKILRTLSPIALAASALTLLAPAPLFAQTSSQAAASSLVVNRLTQPIDENARVTLKGTVHPLARAANDRGAAPDSMPLDRIHVVLKRSDAQESALKQLISDMHTPGTASYHKWLTPEQFGKQFGPSDQDIATLEAWLQSKGFNVTKVNPGKQTLEMSGSVAQLRNAFNVQMHKYQVDGQTHYANATNPQIPAALAPVFGGFASLNNFRPRSYAKALGKATYNPKTDKAVAQWTTDSGGPIPNLALAPGDFAVQYDLPPASTADGTNQTIAIINDSNINISLVNAYRTLFNLPANPPQIIIDGNDPGIDGINNPDGPNGDSVEAYLDVEVAGSVAPKATVDLVIGADTAIELGLLLAAEHAVYGNIAPVASMSFGLGCENVLQSFNQYLSNLWEQAAAQGMTVLVSTGDAGSAGCDNDNSQFYAVGGLAVSGLASTPYNVAVGGTDFYYSSYNQSTSAVVAQLGTYWNLTPSDSAPSVSIKGVIPEQPWNVSQYGLNIFDFYTDSGQTETSIAGGSGGISAFVFCSTNAFDSNGNCTGVSTGYPKPTWQTGTGVPADKVRDIPDLSLFASSGANSSFYPICATDGDCQPVSSGDTVQIFGVGGTSASTPAFAGIMALVNQKYGPQGQADYVLYPLAKQFPTAFHDVVNGNNSEPCNVNTTSVGFPPLDCLAVSNPITITDANLGTAIEGQLGTGTTPGYNATAGYDLATGLGTIDANVLLTNWGNVKFTSSDVTLTPSSANFTHGTAITISGKVTPATGTATGSVALMTSSDEPSQQGQGFPVLFNGGQSTFPLTNGAFSNSSVNYLPGGTYNIWGAYSGDGVNAASSSTPVSITVNPEASGILLNVFTPDPNGGSDFIPNGQGNIPYGTQIEFSAQVAPSSQLSALKNCQTNGGACPTFGFPTGTVVFSDSGKAINTAVLNTEGDAEYNPSDPTLAHSSTNVGTHSITAAYAGDKSYNASTAAATTFTIVQAPTDITINGPATILSGQPATITVIVETQGVGGAPTGTVSVSGGPSGTPASVPVTSTGVDFQSGTTTSYATVVIPSTASAKSYNMTFTYNGDSNYTSSQEEFTIAVTNSGLKPSTTTLTTSLPATSPTALVGVTITVTGQGTVAPTGSITLLASAYQFTNPIPLVPVAGTDRSTASISLDSSGSLQGANVLTAVYSGDSVYATSSSPAVTLGNPLADFSMVPNTTIVPVTAGSNATDTIQLTSVNSFSGVVNYTCTAAAGITCSINPTSTNFTSGGNGTATLTISAGSSAVNGNYNVLVTGTGPSAAFVHTLGIQAVVTGGAAPATPNFSLTNNGANPSAITAGGSATTTITATPNNGFSDTIAFTPASCTVSGVANATSVPTCSFNPASLDVSGAAVTSTLTLNTTSTTTAGAYNITVTGTSGTLTEVTNFTLTVNSPANATFTLSSSTAAAISSPGGSTTSTITVNPMNGFTGTVALTCAVTTSPTGAIDAPGCSFNPPSTTSTSILTVTTTAATSGALDLPLNKFFAAGGGIVLAGLLFFGIPAKRRSWRTILGVIVFAIVVGMGIGCGSSGSGGGGTGNGGTTTGNYVITVTGTSGSLAPVTTTISVTVN